MRKIRLPIILLVCVLVCHSCNTCSRSQRISDITVDLADFAIDSTYADMAMKVFYALPTPIEMSILIKNSGIAWNVDLLSDPADASKFLTHKKMALNFGIYVTDLTYAGLFQQSQTALRYKLALQKLIEGLGLQSSINVNTMRLLEENINDKDMLLRVISDTYSSCSASLNESDRYSLTLTILAGGWVEGMYISTGTLNENLLQNEDKIKQLVIDQILTFDMMWHVMSELRNIPDIDNLLSEFSGLAQLFDQIGIFQTENIVNDIADISEIASSNIINVTPEDFQKIKVQIQILRNSFTKI